MLLALSMPGPALGCDVPGPTEIEGVAVDPFCDDWCALALPANVTGHPACAVPTGVTPTGCPSGVR